MTEIFFSTIIPRSRLILVAFIACIEWERKRTMSSCLSRSLRLNRIFYPVSSFRLSVSDRLQPSSKYRPRSEHYEGESAGGGGYPVALTSRDITLMWISLYYRVVARRESRWETFSVWTTDLAFDGENLPWNVCKDERCSAMYRDASDWWGPRTFLVLYANYRLI